MGVNFMMDYELRVMMPLKRWTLCCEENALDHE